MKDWSRRNLLRSTAGAALGVAVAVPMTALSGTAAAAEPAGSGVRGVRGVRWVGWGLRGCPGR